MAKGGGITPRVQALSVVSWASLERVRPGSMLIMAEEKVQYCFVILSALGMNRIYGIAVTVGGMLSAAAIGGMLVLIVINIKVIQQSILDFYISLILWCCVSF